jgi:group I intron endonuclease
MPDISKCDYSKALIYKIICKNPEIKEVYVGSTCNFKRRIIDHKRHSKIKNLKVYTFINENGGWNNWTFEIIQDYSCSGLEELNILEDHYIKEMGTLNDRRAIYDDKEYHKKYYELNKNKISEQKKTYDKLNRNKINEWRRLYHVKKKAEAKKNVDNMRLDKNKNNIDEEYKMDSLDVKQLKMPELKELVRRYGLKRTSKLTKAQLVNVLVEHLESIVAEPVEPVKAEDVLELPTQEIEEAVAELSVESEDSPPEESPPKKTKKPRKRKTISDSD